MTMITINSEPTPRSSFLFLAFLCTLHHINCFSGTTVAVPSPRNPLNHCHPRRSAVPASASSSLTKKSLPLFPSHTPLPASTSPDVSHSHSYHLGTSLESHSGSAIDITALDTTIDTTATMTDSTSDATAAIVQQPPLSSSDVVVTGSGLPLFSPASKFSSDKKGLARRRRWLVVDFDGTCTEHDTTPLLPKLAAFAHRSRSSILSNDSKCATITEEATNANGSKDADTKNVEQIESDTTNTASTLETIPGEEYNHEQDLERRLSLFQELENEFLRRYGEAKSSLQTLFDDDDDGDDDKDDNDQSSNDGTENKEKRKQIPTIHDILDALDEPSNIVTQMVSESRVLHGLGHADSSELEEMLHLHGTTTSPAASADVEGGMVGSVGELADDNKTDDGNTNTKAGDFDKVVVRLRHGCERTLARLLSQNMDDNDDDDEDESSKESKASCLGWSLAVLSINWCPALIDASLVKPVLRKRQHLLLESGKSEREANVCSIKSLNLDTAKNNDAEIPIWSNHVDGEGKVTLHVPGALAKRDKIAELRRRLHEECESMSHQPDVNGGTEAMTTSFGTRSMIVYVGDSSTDLAALLEADIGIIMGKSSSTVMIAERWGIQIFPLQQRGEYGFGDVIKGSNERKDKKMLWQVESWQEIDDMLRELDEYWR